MKKLWSILAATLVLVAGSCSSTYHSGASNSDDVYYSPKDNHSQSVPTSTPGSSASDYSINNSQQENSGANQQENPSSNNQTSPNQNTDYYGAKTTDGSGNTYITNNYYNDDYYDYAYSSRLKRFYTPAYGYGYYDPYYTNLYWYDYNPYSWGVSIYMGYNWWAPSYYYSSPFCYGGIYDPWHLPCYGGYGSYPVYGYYNGTYSYYNPYYYNSYDPTSYYYGPRGTTSNNIRANTGTRNSTFANKTESKTIGEKYVEAVNTGRISPPPRTDVIASPNTKNILSNPGTTRNNNGVIQSSNPSTEKNNEANPAVPNSKNSMFGTSGINGSQPSNSNVPTKGIITNKNENGKNQVNQPQQINPDHSNPTQHNPVKNNTLNNTGRNNVGRRTNQNSSQPNQISTSPNKEVPRNIPPREEQNNSKPAENPAQDSRQRDNNNYSQPSAPQNNERKPREMSNLQYHRSNVQQSINPTSRLSPTTHSGNYSSHTENRSNYGGSHGGGGGSAMSGSRGRR